MYTISSIKLRYITIGNNMTFTLKRPLLVLALSLLVIPMQAMEGLLAFSLGAAVSAAGFCVEDKIKHLKLDRKLLHATNKKNNFNEIKDLVEAGANINTYSRWYQFPFIETPLNNAAKLSDLQLMEFLIQRDADVNAHSPFCSTLSYTISNSNDKKKESDVKKMVQLLLDAGARIDFSPGVGTPPLVYAILKEYKSVIRLLLERGAKWDKPFVNNGTALHTAAMKGNEWVELVVIQVPLKNTNRIIAGLIVLLRSKKVNRDIRKKIASMLIANEADEHLSEVEGKINNLKKPIDFDKLPNLKDPEIRNSLHKKTENNIRRLLFSPRLQED